jgi:predicted ATPase
MSICPAAYFRSPELMAFAGLRIVAYSLRYGNGPASSFGYVLYGLISGAMLGRYKAGNAFGRLAIELAQQSGSRTQLCKIMMIYAGFVCFWREPLQVAVSIVERALELALDVGDVQYANYSILQVRHRQSSA